MNEAKIIQFTDSAERYKILAENKAEKGDFVSSLGYLFSSLKIEYSHDILSMIAETYSDMGLLSLSNAYWFKYLACCPTNKMTTAYEQLAINYFYMEEYFASSYYFHLKLSKDGFISKEGLEEEVIEFFSQNFDKKSTYHLAYPFERADWSFEEKMAKHALSVGDFKNAKKLYSKIPKECLTEESFGEYSMALFLDGNDKELIDACNDSLVRHGENVTAYCNLSSLYFAKKDKAQSNYYYQQALRVNKNTISDACKLATCAMEQEDHYNASVNLQKIVKERTYDVNMSFFYAIAQANCGNYESACNSFCEIYRIYPQDSIVKFYAEYLTQVAKSNSDYKNLFPLPYEKALPSCVTATYKRKITELFNDPKKALSQIKREDVKNALKWALIQDDVEYAKNAVFIMSNANTQWAEDTLLKALMDIDVCGEVKRSIIIVLILRGHKEVFSVIANDFFVKVKPKKLVCENKIDGELYLAGYAICLSMLAFWNIDGFEKIAFSINKLYKKLGNEVYADSVTPEEIGAMAVCISGFERLKNPAEVCKFFDVRENIVLKYLQRITNSNKKGEENDKNS